MQRVALSTKDKLPTHIAFIIDGNGRWAQRHKLLRMDGHKAGFDNLLKIIDHVYDLKIPNMSVYAFSTENWNRPKAEITGLMNIFKSAFNNEALNAEKRKIQIRFSGDLSVFDDSIRGQCQKLAHDTVNNTSMVINFCINYGGRQEIVRAVNQILSERRDSIDINDFGNYLYTAGMPDVDFVIRSSGEYRTSNFMPYQCTYAELYFPKKFWPAITYRDIDKALKNYSKRDRRYGSIKG